ncbi:TPA: hypothetical protein ACTYZB_004827 [Klebsiella variicola]
MKTKVYITKYALSKGPLCVQAEIKNNGKMVVWKERLGGFIQYSSEKDFWMTEEEALADCERRREAKLDSLAKQKKKLNKIVFNVKMIEIEE